MSTKKKKRLQFDVSEETLEFVDRAKGLADAGTRAQVFRDALRLYIWFLSEREKGSKFILKNDEEERQIEFVF